METKQALIVVDYQNDFIPEAEGGTGGLGVTGGGLLAPAINEAIKFVKTTGGLIVATCDWHPAGHMSLAANYANRNRFEQIGWNDVVNAKENTLQLTDRAEFTLKDLQAEFGAGLGKQVLWPDHCIAGTPGAEYFGELNQDLIDTHIIKGYDPRTEMYSGFYGKQQREDKKVIGLADILRDAGVGLVKVVGLATDYCVHATALDALRNGFNVEVLTKAIAGVTPEDSIKRLEELRDRGAEIVE